VALEQGRFTFRHDLVLQEISNVLKSFLSSYKVSSAPKKAIYFVKEGTTPKKQSKKTNHGLLHLAPDWIMLTDLNEKLIIPSFIVITQLRPDIVLFSKATKTVIILELTCPCEENMEEWHRVKFNKYEPLSEAIKCNGWAVHLFPIEIGARGYCALTLRSCFLRLGLPYKLVRATIKSLSLIAIKASFQIWLSRENKTWTNSKTSTPVSKTFKTPTSNASHGKAQKVHLPTQSINNDNTVSKCGLLNKGNTCYMNSALQCFSTMVPLWSNLSMYSNNLSPFILSFIRIMSMLKTCRAAIDPSPFLQSFQNLVHKAGNLNFNIHRQQDAAEMITYILEELFTECVQTQAMINVTITNETTCNFCFQSVKSEDMSPILRLPVAPSIKIALENFLRPQDLCENESFFCNVCSSYKTATLTHEVVSSGQYLILQIERFIHNAGIPIKDIKDIECSPTLDLLLVVNQVETRRKFRLAAVINHFGTMNNGHYTALIRPHNTTTWWLCNDALVKRSKDSSFTSSSCYICFYEAI